MKKYCTALLLILLFVWSPNLQARVDNPADTLQEDPKIVFKDFVNHLEFLGYTATTKKKAVHFKHPKNINFLFRMYRGGYLLTATFEGSEQGKQHLSDFLRLCNLGNSSATVAKFYLDKDKDFIVEAWYGGVYDKKHFGTFLNNWNTDWQLLLRQANAQLVKFLK